MKRNILNNIIGLCSEVNLVAVCVLSAAMVFTSCEKQDPFDTQTENDEPLILKPYNESGTGSFTYNLASPQTPLLDSVTVTPSAYTTVNWYIDDQLVYTGNRIEMCFLAGKYNLTIEAVTTAGKRTTRTGTVTVQPNAEDPYSGAPAAGRHMVPGETSALEGVNLLQVAEIALTSDVFGVQVVETVTPTSIADNRVEFVLPEMADGIYFIRLKDATGKRYGADKMQVHNSSVALAGYESFVPGEEWVITGAKLNSVVSVTVDDIVITELVAASTSVTLTAPDAAVGEHTISMKNADGSDVLFITDEGAVTQTKTVVSAETTIWTGPVALDWNADLVNISKEIMSEVPVGSTILVYFEIPEAEYHNLRITTPWWGDDLVAQFDVTDETPNPFTFIYDDRCKGIVEMVGSWSIVGFGETINKITFK